MSEQIFLQLPMSEIQAKQKAFAFLQKYLNNARRDVANANETKNENPTSSTLSKKEDDLLTKKAIVELEREICINKVKRKAFGSVTAPKTRANKRFLETTLVQCLNHNTRRQQKTNANSNEKLKDLVYEQRLKNSEKKFGERKHDFKKPEKKKRRRSSSSSDE